MKVNRGIQSMLATIYTAMKFIVFQNIINFRAELALHLCDGNAINISNNNNNNILRFIFALLLIVQLH